MSEFSTKRSKAAAAFKGAAKNIFKPRNLVIDAISIAFATGIVALTAGGALLPVVAAAAAACMVYDGAKGVRKALDDGTRPSDQVNVTPDKVVALKEWRKKAKANYKQGLSFAERVYLNVIDKPLSIPAGISLAFNRSVTSGMYKDDNKKAYVNGAAVNNMAKHSDRFALSKKFQGKVNKLSAEAFEQCEDHNPKLATRQLKRI